MKDLDLAKVLIIESSDLEISHLESIKEFKLQIPDFFVRVLQEGIEKGEFININPQIYAVIMFNSIRGLVEEIIKNKDKKYVLKAKEELKKFILKGIEKGDI